MRKLELALCVAMIAVGMFGLGFLVAENLVTFELSTIACDWNGVGAVPKKGT